eukprot:TRINITY_DN289_c1_g1_i15.p1 TRINITY_DN289_c1_g1~~TRINITY_DN289_c1_g1_i15.p1  ORF type:complete len:403 (+),score=7.63 TRINITY_DN289_c1_g1_i15:111-1319(+)
MTKRQTKVPGRFDSFEMGTPRNRRQPESKKATFLVPLRYGSDRDGPEFRDTPVAGGDVLPEHQESPVEASGQDVEHGDQESPVNGDRSSPDITLSRESSDQADTRSRAFHGRRRACSTSAAQSTAERQEGKRRMTDHVECDICHETRTWRGFSNHRKWCLYVQAVSATRSPAPEARKRGRPRMEPTQARKRGRPNKTQATERRPENPEVSTQPPPEEENPGSVGSAPPEMVAADIEETIYDSDFQANGDWSSIDAAQVDRQDRIDDDLTTQVDETEDGPPEAAQPTAERQDDEPSDDDSACPNATDQEIWPDPIDLEQDLPSQPQPEEGAELEDSSYFTTVSIANSDDPRDESYCLDDPHSPFDTVQVDAYIFVPASTIQSALTEGRPFRQVDKNDATVSTK